MSENQATYPPPQAPPHPVEPGFDLIYVASLIPVRADTLRRHLSDHKEDYPKRYRLEGPLHRRTRVLLASEVRMLRAHFVRATRR